MMSATPTPLSASVSTAIDFIQQSLSELCPSEDHQPRFYFDNPRRFCSFASRLQFILQQLLHMSLSPESLTVAALTTLKGIAADLSVAADVASLYSKRSKIFVLVNCRSLCDSLQERTSTIAKWLALLDSDLLDLRKKIADLSRDMKQTQFTVTKNEERVHCMLPKEGQGRRTSKAVQSVIIMDLARALGIEFDNYSKLSEQVKLFKDNLTCFNSIFERKILVSLERPKCFSLSKAANYELHADTNSPQASFHALRIWLRSG